MNPNWTRETVTFYTVNDAAVRIGCSTSTVKALVRDQKMKVARTIKRFHLLTESQVEQLKAEFVRRQKERVRQKKATKGKRTR